MADIPEVSRCANSDCGAQFKRLGKGRLSIFGIEDAQAWGLPKHAKQKAVWLCERCAAAMYVRLDRRRHQVQVVHKTALHHRHAA